MQRNEAEELGHVSTVVQDPLEMVHIKYHARKTAPLIAAHSLPCR